MKTRTGIHETFKMCTSIASFRVRRLRKRNATRKVSIVRRDRRGTVRFFSFLSFCFCFLFFFWYNVTSAKDVCFPFHFVPDPVVVVVVTRGGDCNPTSDRVFFLRDLLCRESCSIEHNRGYELLSTFTTELCTYIIF